MLAHERCLPKKRAASRVKSGLSEIWLPFVNEYRTVCTTPSPEMKVYLRSFYKEASTLADTPSP
jgi:hypothetical protein